MNRATATPENELYSRQNEMPDLRIPETATIVGCGGTGYWTALFLAMSGVTNLILIDNDIIELSNLNRLPINQDYIGLPKTSVLRQHILRLRPGMRIERHQMKVETNEHCQIMREVVFCCTDNLTSQQLICAYCKKNNLPYQRIGYDGTTLNVSKAFPLSFEGEETRTGYTVTPSWVIPAALAASLGVSSKLYKEMCIMDDISKVVIADSSFLPDALKEMVFKQGEDNIKDNIGEHIGDEYGFCDGCSRPGEAERRGFSAGYTAGKVEGIALGKREGHIAGYQEAKRDFDEHMRVNKRKTFNIQGEEL